MTAGQAAEPGPAGEPGIYPGLTAKLVAAIRPEFRRDVLVFAADAPVFGGTACRVGTCGRVSRSSTGLCKGHYQRWRSQGRPDLDGFAASTSPLTGARLRNPGIASADGLPASESSIDLRPLPAQLRLEMQYALQCRRDELAGKARPQVAQRVVRFLAQSPARSLLDRPGQEWRQDFPVRPRSSEQGLLAYAHRAVEDLARGHGWDAEYPRDTWRLRSLGISGPHATLRFDRIPQQWLKDLAKQWTRSRLVTGISSSHASSAVTAITRFGQFLRAAGKDVQLSDIDRELLERYLAYLGTAVPGTSDRITHIGQLNMFLQGIRRHQWDSGLLPATAAIFREDYPRLPEPLPRFLAEHVMAQVEDPGNLDKWKDPNWRLITVILIRCGLRISSATSLAFDCVVTDAAGAPYLRYYNTKMKREALVPIDNELCQMIRDHRKQVLSRWPGTVPVLFPRTKANIDGTRPVRSETYRTALYRWLDDCDVRDEHGQPLHLTPHQWRHTLGTRLKMGRIAFDASFGSSREHALPAAQRAALRCPRPAGPPRGYGDQGLHGPRGSDATMMQLIPLRGLPHHCACWHRNASESSQLHQAHHRQAQRAAPAGTAAARDPRDLRIIGRVTRPTWQPAALVAPGASPPPEMDVRAAASSPVSHAARRRADAPRTWPPRIAVPDRRTLLAWTCDTAGQIRTRNHQPGE